MKNAKLSRAWRCRLAERQGFEPWIRCRIRDFESRAFDHSAISPLPIIAERPVRPAVGHYARQAIPGIWDRFGASLCLLAGGPPSPSASWDTDACNESI